MSNSGRKPSFIRDLFDFRMRRYITRRVASVFYLFYLIIIPLVTLMLTYGTFEWIRTQFADNSFHWQYLAIWITGPIIGFISLVYVRILFELNIAVVNIAENTEPKE